MAKYRITSIPQSLPKAQLGLFKNKNTSPLWEAQSVPVFPDQESSIEDVMPRRTAEEQANIFPIINPDLSGSAEYDFSKSCPNRQIFYRGQCVSEDVLNVILQREQETEKFQAKESFRNQQIAHNKMLDDLYIKNMQIAQEEKNLAQKIKHEDYVKDFKKSKKSTQIKPLDVFDTNTLSEMVPVIGDDGKVVMDEETGKPKMQTRREALSSQYLLIDNDENSNIGSTGTTSAWPLAVVADRIYNSGFQPTQFKTIWKFNDDQVRQVKEQTGSLMENAKNAYDNEAYNRILKKALELNITPEEAAKIVAGKNSSFGYAESLTKEYAPNVQKIINTAFEDLMKKTGSSADAEKLSPTQKELLLNLEETKDQQFLNINGGHYVTDKDGYKIWVPPGVGANIMPLPAESTAVRNKIGAWTTDPATGKKQWVAPNNNTAYENAQAEKLIKEQENMVAQIQYAALRRLIESPDVTDAERLKIANDPKKLEKLISEYVNWSYSPEGEFDPRREQTQGEYRYTPGHLKSDFKITPEGAQWSPGRYGQGRYIDGPVNMVYPEKYVMGPGAGVLGGGLRLLNKPLASFIGSSAAPWLTAGNLFGAYTIYNAVRPEGTISSAYDKFSEGDYKGGALKSLEAALELFPTVGIISKGAKLLKSTPRFFEYTAPSGRTFGLGNANLPNITTAEKPEQFLSLMTGSNASQLKNLYSTEADIINAEKALASGQAFPRYTFTHPAKTQLQLEQAYQNLDPKEFMLKNLGFRLGESSPIEFGTFSQPTKYSTKFGEFTFGPKRFYPAKLESIDFKSPTVYDEGSVNMLGLKEGGYLPQAQGGLIALAKNLSKGLAIPVSSTVSALRKIPATYTAIAEGGNLF